MRKPMKKQEGGYYLTRHGCFLLQYHLVLVTKYRKPAITGELEQALKQYTETYFSDRDCIILAMEAMPDHVHILFDAPIQINLLEFINAFKTASSRRMRTDFGEMLKQWYWEPFFWSHSYYIGTVSETTTQVVQNYIKNQKEEK